MLSQVVNNLFTIVQNRLQQCCAAPCQQGLLTILFTLVRTMLLTPDERTRPEQRCWNNWDQPDINDVLYCQQLRTVLFYQYVNSLISIVFDAVIRGHFPGGKRNLNSIPSMSIFSFYYRQNTVELAAKQYIMSIDIKPKIGSTLTTAAQSRKGQYRLIPEPTARSAVRGY